ncbi:MAG: lipid-A-disaccharide synthase [Bacteroidetes bacterium RIFCSPHIGHO2_02_FULL_44_7]|nr:MAG: lipid-A-disaccharide synthase [Bacteroidetes bacterium RIFCSPHIGHO2_02_FULL_44_7]
MKCYIIAGEASGDLHAANLMRAMIKEDPTIDFRFWGGDRMAQLAPSGLVKHIRDLAFMGFVEVFMNLRTILKNMRFCKEDIESFTPDVLILVDYPGFNLRIAEWASQKGIKVHYYISPQVWAWKKSRVYKIKKFVDKMYVILPFEKEFYARYDYVVDYVGHPLLDEIAVFKERNVATSFRMRNGLDERPILALLPGSRKQEVLKKLPIMLQAIEGMDAFQIVLAGAPSLSEGFYRQIAPRAHIVFNETYALLANTHTALVTSGTATLEAALFKVPEVVCYKGSPISYIIAKQLVDVKYISLVNLIMDREVVLELIQKECTPAKIRQEVDRLIGDKTYREALLNAYDELELVLGGGGASEKVAQSLLKTIRTA